MFLWFFLWRSASNWYVVCCYSWAMMNRQFSSWKIYWNPRYYKFYLDLLICRSVSEINDGNSNDTSGINLQDIERIVLFRASMINAAPMQPSYMSKIEHVGDGRRIFWWLVSSAGRWHDWGPLVIIWTPRIVTGLPYIILGILYVAVSLYRRWNVPF